MTLPHAGELLDRTWTLHWDGETWTAVASPNASAVVHPGTDLQQRLIGGSLRAIAAIATDDVWAVGSAVHPLIEHWDGVRWSIAPSARIGDEYGSFESAAGTSFNDVWAVGEYRIAAGPNVSLIEHWDGAAWGVVPLPARYRSTASLWGVAARSARDAWVVGSQYDSTTHGDDTLILHWDGTAWVRLPSPNQARRGRNTIDAVAASSADYAWAVGWSMAGLGAAPRTRPLVEHWDGTRWSIVPAPMLPHAYGETLSSVIAPNKDTVLMVGSEEFVLSQAPRIHQQRPLEGAWNGSAVTLSATPGSTHATWLSATAMTSSGVIWRIGGERADDGSSIRAFVERYCAPPL